MKVCKKKKSIIRFCNSQISLSAIKIQYWWGSSLCRQKHMHNVMNKWVPVLFDLWL